MLRVLLASEAESIPDYPDWRAHVAYLDRMARGAERAAATEDGMAQSARDDRRGRAPDYNLQSLITLLMDVFQKMLAVRATHTWKEYKVCSDSLFDSFVHDAIKSFRPPGVKKITPRKIDYIIQRQLPGRDLEFDDSDEFFAALERAESERAERQ
jgi:hypothetical protein